MKRVTSKMSEESGITYEQKGDYYYRFVGVIDVPYVQKIPVLMETRQGVAIRYVSGGQTA